MGHDIEKYQIGGGVLSIGNSGGGGYVDMGNCPGAEITYKVSTKIHERSWNGTIIPDKIVQTKVDVSLKFSLDEIGAEQLAIYFQAQGGSTGYISPCTAVLPENSLLFTPDYETGEQWQVPGLEGTDSAGASAEANQHEGFQRPLLDREGLAGFGRPSG